LNILLIKPSSLGDVVHALPTANLLRRNFPKARIAWLINDTLVGLLKNCPVIDVIIPFYRERWRRIARWSEFLLYLRKLSQQQFDLTIDLQGLFRSGVLARGSGAPRRIGLSDAREGARYFYTETVPIPARVTHAVDRYLGTIRHLGFETAPIEFPFGHNSEDRAAVDDLLRNAGAGDLPLIALSPSARWENKCWPIESYAELVRELTSKWQPHRVVLLVASDRRTVGGAAALPGWQTPARPPGRALAPLLALYRQRHGTDPHRFRAGSGHGGIIWTDRPRANRAAREPARTHGRPTQTNPLRTVPATGVPQHDLPGMFEDHLGP
jgi:ADP-heptose:LPS heptosyltransferase